MAFKSDKQRKGFFGSRTTVKAGIIPTIRPLKLKSNRLPVQFSIIVPRTSNDRKLSRPAFLKRVDNERRFMSRTFGGDTSIKASGDFELKERGKTIRYINERPMKTVRK